MKKYLPTGLAILIALTLSGDYLRSPSPEKKTAPGSSSSAPPGEERVPSQDHGDSTEFRDTLDHAFDTAPHPDHRHKDPEKERRMGIYHYNEGNRFLKKGDWKEAVRNYKMALHHDKTLHPVYINMSNAYLKGEQYPEALKTLQALQAQAPRQPELHYNFACYYSLTHQEKAALESLKKAVSLGYSKPDDFQSDPDLENLRRTADFAEWLAKL